MSVLIFQYKESPEAFSRTAKHWAQAYAGVNHSMPELESKIKQLLDMGFDEVRIKESNFIFFGQKKKKKCKKVGLRDI